MLIDFFVILTAKLAGSYNRPCLHVGHGDCPCYLSGDEALARQIELGA